MSLNVDPVEVKFLADMSQLKRDMETLKETVVTGTRDMERNLAGSLGGFGKGFEEQVGKIKGALAGLGVGLSVAGFATWVKGTIDAADNLNDLSKRIGISVRDLATWKLAADQSGTSLEAVGKGVKGLSTYMVENSERLKAAGITAKDANGALIQLADLFAKLPDGLTKTALATKLLGRGGMEMIPMLNEGSKGLAELAEKSRLYGERMEMLAPAADKFNDQLAEFKLNSSAAAVAMANDLMPMLNMLAADLLDFRKSTASAASSFNPTAEALKAVVILFGNTGFVLKGVGTEIGGISAQLAALAKGDFSSMASIGKMMKEDADRARKEFDEWEKRILALGTKMQKAGSGAVVQSSGAVSSAAVGKTDSSDAEKRAKSLLGVGDDEVKKTEEAYQALIKSLKEKSAVTAQALEQEEALTEGQKRAMEIMVGIRDNTLKLTEARKIAVTAELEAIITNEKAAIARKEFLKHVEEERKAENDRLQAQFKAIDSLDEEIKKQREHNAEIGLTVEQLNAVKLARMDDTLAIRERQLAQEIAAKGDTAAAEALRIQIEQLRELRNITASGQVKQVGADAAKKAEEDWKKTSENIERSLTDALMRGFEGGKDAAQVFRETLINMFKTLVLQPLLKPIVEPWAQAMTGIGQQIANALSGAVGGGWSDAQFSAQAAAEAAIPLEAFGGYYPNANGNVFAAPNLSALSGRVLDRPTIIPFARGGALAAEAGPEAIMPLRRGRDGRLGVETTGGGGDVNVTVNNYSQAQVSTRSSVVDGKREIQIFVENALNAAINGGRLDAAMGSNFGAGRIGVSRG